MLAGDGVLLSGHRDHELDLPSLGQAGARALGAAVLAALRTRPAGAVAAGVIPFDPAERPDLFVIDEPQRTPFTASVEIDVVPGQDPLGVLDQDDPGYRRAVETALEHLDGEQLRKVVLARSVDVPVGALPPETIWARLAAANPRGWTFSVRTAAGTFVGASPELVASVTDDGLATHPLAGSTPRAEDPVEDEARARALLASAKDRHEHAFVVDHIVDRLGPLLGVLHVPAGPSVVRTDSMLHLGTRITGRLRPEYSVLDAALAIHPTPAVCGIPTDLALEQIRTLEASRGPYAGLVGWVDARGQGCWALALRCALVGAGRARLFAGAGVVRGSTPQGEHAETAAKLRTVAAALAPTTTPDAEDHR